METKTDKWVVIQIGNVDPIYKVFASWAGGYLDGDSWRLNSGIESVEDAGEYYNIIGYSGSVYACWKTAYGIATAYSENVLNNIITRAVENDITVTIMPADTDWLDLIK
jgi:hypothetical protein